MRLILIAPTVRRRRGPGHVLVVPPMSLCAVAAATPPEVEVSIIDEAVEAIDFHQEADLVGITAMTSTAPRAYEIARAFRDRGKKVVLGGMHPSALPTEALQSADAVLIGEAEGIWPQVVEDARQDRLARIYQSPRPPDPELIPPPRRELLKKEGYITTAVVQTSRGCPHGCAFCTVSKFFGRAYRFRPLQQVLDEIGSLKEKLVLLIDDNILAVPRHAQELFQRMIGLGKRWLGQASLSGLRDPALLKLAARSGCRALFVGFESLSQAALDRFGKGFNIVSRYQDVISRLHDVGIGVIASFMFGLDEDTEATFEQTLAFAERSRVDILQLSILTPLPGTRLYEEMEEQGRIIDRNWAHYDGGHVVFLPHSMPPERLLERFHLTMKQAYSLLGIWKRLGLEWLSRPLSLPLNLGFRARLRYYFASQRKTAVSVREG